MLSRKGTRLLNRLIRWSKMELISRPSYLVCKEVIQRTQTFSDSIAFRVYILFVIFFPHTADQLEDMEVLLTEHRLELALELRRLERDYDTLVDMIEDSDVADPAVENFFFNFMDDDKVRIHSLSLLRMIERHRPELATRIASKLDTKFSSR